MSNIAIAVHGGAGRNSAYLKQNLKGRKAALEEALQNGYAVLKKEEAHMRIARFRRKRSLKFN